MGWGWGEAKGGKIVSIAEGKSKTKEQKKKKRNWGGGSGPKKLEKTRVSEASERGLPRRTLKMGITIRATGEARKTQGTGSTRMY